MSSEIDNAVGEAPARVKDKSAGDLLNEKKTKLAEARERYQTAKTMRDEEGMSLEGRTIDALVTLIAELEQESVVEREQIATHRAQARMVAISRAYGSVAHQIDEDEKLLDVLINGPVTERTSRISVTAAVQRMKDRYTKATMLRAEAAALAHRFGFDKLQLPTLIPPARREIATTMAKLGGGLLDHPSIRQPLEQCEHRLRERRTYREIEGTESYKIIEAAGLRPFPELNETQQEIVEGRQRQAAEARRQFARHAGEGRERWGSSS